jgi:hypothetical protein
MPGNVKYITVKQKLENSIFTWIIHEPRLPQIRGAGDEAVVLHCESAATK